MSAATRERPAVLIESERAVNSLTKEQKLYVVAGGFGLFIISLFLNYVGAGDFSVNGLDALPSGWLWLVAAAVAGGVCVANALRIDLPNFVDDTLALLLGFAIAFMMVAVLFEGHVKFGFFLGLLGALVGFGGLLWTRSDRV